MAPDDAGPPRPPRKPARPGTGAGRPAASGRPAPRGGSGREQGRPAGDRRPRADERRGTPDDRPYDPRREARRERTRVHVPEDVDARELDAQTRKQLLALTKDTADLVARHLVMAGRLMDEAPEQALRHA